jgi:asparagine synthetase B (glutamine-hydrolysing)
VCGVLGIIETSPSAIVQLNAAKLMSKCISHRGSDDEGYVVFENGSPPNTFCSSYTPSNARAAYSEARDASEELTKGKLLRGYRRTSMGKGILGK